jgi:alpha-1,3-rhamnosyl/mannosyltransferase
LTGYISQSDLPFLYAGARLFVYPSLQEGFGFPPLEAMACGVPTISSLSSSLTENLQGAAELVPPGDVGLLADAIKRMLLDESLRARRREQGLERALKFRWEETARETLSCYRAAAKARSS